MAPHRLREHGIDWPLISRSAWQRNSRGPSRVQGSQSLMSFSLRENDAPA
jgi:hypothetical protein